MWRSVWAGGQPWRPRASRPGQKPRHRSAATRHIWPHEPPRPPQAGPAVLPEPAPGARVDRLRFAYCSCQNYEDGTSSHWTDAQITLAIERCTSEKEVLRRIMGKFVKESVFDLEHTLPLDRDVHLVKPFWLQGYAYYAGIDYGSGGIRTSQSSVFIIAVHPDYDRGYVVYHRRYDREQLTAQNLLDKLVEHASLKKIALAEVAFDYAAPDIGIIGEAMGLPISKANKRRKAGHQIFYSLLKENRIFWFDSDEVEFEKFSQFPRGRQHGRSVGGVGQLERHPLKQ